MLNSSRTLVLLSSLALFTFPALAQVPVSAPSAPSSRETGPTGKVTLEVVVDRKADEPLAGLQQQDFSILDNKVARPITSFRAVAESAHEAHVLLIIDAVNTSFNIVANERQQIDKYLKSNDGHLANPTTLAIFTDKGLEIQPGETQDGHVISASLEQYTIGLRSIRRDSGFYGADERMQLSLKTLGQLIRLEDQRPGRKIVIWISPGWPLLSGPEVELTQKQSEGIFNEIVALSTQLRKARMTIYSVDPIGAAEDVRRTFYYKQFVKGVTKPGQANLGNLGLQVLAEQTGGRAFTSNNDVTDMIKTAVSDASAFYELTFEAPPADHPDEYHQIAVQVAKPGLTVRAQQGYYDQP